MQSIGDFAEKLILGQVDDVKSGKALAPSLEEAASSSTSRPAKDIRNIEVPNSFMKEVLGEGYTQEEPAYETKPELVWTDPEEAPPKPEPQPLTEETVGQLISLLEDLKSVVSDLKEMTSSGSFGPNFGGSTSVDVMGSKSNGYITPGPKQNKRKKRAALAAALRRKQ